QLEICGIGSQGRRGSRRWTIHECRKLLGYGALSQVFDAAGAGDHASHQQPRRFAEALTQPNVMAQIIDSQRQAMKIQLTTGLSEAEGCGELGVPAAA